MSVFLVSIRLSANLLNGERLVLDDPGRPWEQKMGAITRLLNKERDKLVILCGEPTVWHGRRGDVPGERHGEQFANWIGSQAECRRIITGYIPEDHPARAWQTPPRLEDWKTFLDEMEWGAARALAESISDSPEAGDGSGALLKIKLRVALSRFEAPESASGAQATSDLLQAFLDRVDHLDSAKRLKSALASLAIARGPLARPTFEKLTSELEEIDHDLVHFCLSAVDGDQISLHPEVRLRVLEKSWRFSTEHFQAWHRLLRQEYETQKLTYRDQLESLHHELLSTTEQLREGDRRLRFVEQLHEVGKMVSLHYRDHPRAAAIFRFALKINATDSYSHHYLAFNLDWTADQPAEVEQHYRQAIQLRPTHPWFWSRWISYLATRGRFAEARSEWSQAVDALSVSNESPDWIFRSLHRWVARWLLHWSELDFAEYVLHSVPRKLAEQDTSFGALENLLAALRLAEVGPAVFPLSIPVDSWWLAPAGHTKLPAKWNDQHFQSWRPARVESLSLHSVVLLGATLNESSSNHLSYFEVELSRAQVERAAHLFSWSELTEGSFLELGYYNEQILRIALHRNTAFRDPHLLTLRPPPDRWYRRAVGAAWKSLEGDHF